MFSQQRDASPAGGARYTDSCADGSWDRDPGQNDARISPRFCLSEVTSDRQIVNHHPSAHHLYQDKCPGRGLAKAEAVSLAGSQKKLILALTGRSFLFSVSGRDPRDYFAGSTSCNLQLICSNDRKRLKMCKANQPIAVVISLCRQGHKRLHPL